MQVVDVDAAWFEGAAVLEIAALFCRGPRRERDIETEGHARAVEKARGLLHRFGLVEVEVGVLVAKLCEVEFKLSEH